MHIAVHTYGRQVFGLGARSTVSLCIPPLEVFKTFSRHGFLPVPRSVMLKVYNCTVPTPRLSNPGPFDALTVRGVLVEVIPEATAGRSRFGHVNGKTVDLSISKTVSG